MCKYITYRQNILLPCLFRTWKLLDSKKAIWIKPCEICMHLRYCIGKTVLLYCYYFVKNTLQQKRIHLIYIQIDPIYIEMDDFVHFVIANKIFSGPYAYGPNTHTARTHTCYSVRYRSSIHFFLSFVDGFDVFLWVIICFKWL